MICTSYKNALLLVGIKVFNYGYRFNAVIHCIDCGFSLDILYCHIRIS